ncbi:hypothetical protein TeGR_g13707 [Tetraparma gracilis]|uniref:Uncharacterized protein n=1 Tax=Tetraparma gracilis TaxID=2962635 RepID=A0ABQ6MRV0_9STRA|nr:hypothetical protein TeGR_g13707 [Tetraparma gracilis]
MADQADRADQADQADPTTLESGGSTLESVRQSMVAFELSLGLSSALLATADMDSVPAEEAGKESALPVSHPVIHSTLSTLASIKAGAAASGQFAKITTAQALAAAANHGIKETLPIMEDQALAPMARKRRHAESALGEGDADPAVKASALAQVMADQTGDDVFTAFYAALNDLRGRHHKAPSSAAGEETLEDLVVYALGKPAAEGDPRLNRFSEGEVCGRFLDFDAVVDGNRAALRQHIGVGDAPAYAQWLLEASGDGPLLGGDLKVKKRLFKALGDTVGYLVDYKERVQPLLPLEEIARGAEMGRVWEEVRGEWNPEGGGEIDAKKVKDKKELEKYDVAELTAALTANGLKAGGTKAQKIDRLFLLSTTPLDKIPNKHKTKDGAATAADNNSALFVLDFQLTALLRHYRPTLLATAERNKRRLTQTVAEKLAERREILSGNAVEVKEDDSDEEEEIYNPKNLPLGWDGKPIPVWLYKLHGLNKYFHCEICGDETYRGQRDYERHFGESKHTYGMKCLGIPNSRAFHGITKVEDARALWKKMNADKAEASGAADAGGGEQFEDRDGNVMSKQAYETLARQGLL